METTEDVNNQNDSSCLPGPPSKVQKTNNPTSSDAEISPSSNQPLSEDFEKKISLSSDSSMKFIPACKTEPICLLVLGMAGSGKTSLVQRLTADLYQKAPPSPYVLNLDPAVNEVPFPANVDIRDTVKYKDVMKQYSLGPNGAIVTCLNLFATKFDQLLQLIEKRADQCNHVIFDTPGQIEVFTWSASGQIITESLASQFPTVILYVVDTVRCASPLTFMSNMLYACGILYKTRLPFILVLNKADVISPSFIQTWMTDFEEFQVRCFDKEVLQQETSYASNMTRSLSLVLDEFYSTIRSVCISAISGQGINELLKNIDIATKEYNTEYRPAFEKLKRKREENASANDSQQPSTSAVRVDNKSQKLASTSVIDTGVSSSGKLGYLASHIGSVGSGNVMFLRPGDDEDATSDSCNENSGRHAIDSDDDMEEKLEYESFKRFLKKTNGDSNTCDKKENSTSSSKKPIS